MKPFWHPLSALCIPELRVYATPALIRMTLGGEGGADLLYAGDRMGAPRAAPRPVRLEPCRTDLLRAGDVVAAAVGGIPDLLRVVGREPGGRLRLRGDCDPHGNEVVDEGAVLGRARLPRRRVTQAGRMARRLLLDLAEASRQAPDGAGDPATSVLEKYDAQASFYATGEDQSVPPALMGRLVRRVPPPGPLLVVGSGSGWECFSLAAAGYRVRGIDFAPRMVEEAGRGAAGRGLEIEFLEADVRAHREKRSSLGGILFTYDVFSFLPDPAERARLLGDMAEWLAPGGAIFLSARRVERLYERGILTVQWLARGGAVWGDSHTRYVTPDGRLRRSFVHYFSPRRLCAELSQAGFRMEGWRGGHVELSRASG